MKVTIHCEGTQAEIVSQLMDAAHTFGGGAVATPKAEKPAKSTKAEKPAPVETEADEVEETEIESDDADLEVEEEKPAAKKGKAKEISLDDVRAALKTYAAKNSRDKAIAVLKKFKVKSILDLDPAQYGEVMKVLG